jgi:Ca2+-binding RTX toxin-like protein
LSASGSKGDNLLDGGNGNDYLDISGNYEYRYSYSIYDSSTRKYDSRSLGNNTLNGGAGEDTLSASGSKGDNLLNGGDGNDYLDISGNYETGGGGKYSYQFDPRSLGNNTLNGGAGDDSLSASGSTGNNLLSGGDGNDTLSASTDDQPSKLLGNNTLNGGAGDDSLNVDFSLGNNLLDGGDGNDTLSAFYASGKNTLIGGNGNDYLTGGYGGNDSLIGGTGTDTFAFNSFNEGLDTIYDFNATNEVIRVSAAGFGGELSIGSLSDSQFTIGASANTSTQRFIYHSSTGGLFFDQDGNAGMFTQVQFAQLSAGLSLTTQNFLVV